MTPAQRDKLQILIDDYRAAGFSARHVARAAHDLARIINPPPIAQQALRNLLADNGLPVDP